MNNCQDCGFAKNGICILLNIELPHNNYQGCIFHQKLIPICPLCNKPMLKHTGVWIPEFKKFICNNCIDIARSCATCKHRQKAPNCLIEKYHGPLEVLIERTIQVNPIMQATSTQINPAVIEQVCPECKCGSPWNCQRNHKCDNWEVNL